LTTTNGQKVTIYLDCHTVMPPIPAVVEEMRCFFYQKWGVPWAQHQKGIELYDIIDKAIEKIYKKIRAPGSFFFKTTPGKMEAHLEFLFSFYMEAALSCTKPHFFTSSLEEASVLLSLRYFEPLQCSITLLPVNENGQLCMDALKKIKIKGPSLLTFSWVSSLTGVIQPVEEIIDFCRTEGVWVHLNGSHSIGWVDIDWNRIDSLYFDGDKMGTPQGIGGLFQKMAFSKGTNHNVAALCGLSIAMEMIFEMQNSKKMEIARLRDEFEAELLHAIPDCKILFQEVERLPNVCVVSFPSIASEALLYFLQRQGLCATIGGGQYQKLSVQLIECGIADTIANGAISFAFSSETTEEVLRAALTVIVSCVRKLKIFSVAL
jgi:cysteine desulfurase